MKLIQYIVLTFAFYLSVSQCVGQADSLQKHHVIIILDRSGSMQPAQNENVLFYIFKTLEKICFNSVEPRIGRSLLKPQSDYLTIVSFGLKNLSDSRFESYISTSCLFKNSRVIEFGRRYDQSFDSNVITDLYATIKDCGLRGVNSGFFDRQFTFYSTALPLTIKYVGDSWENQRFNRTFIICITDKVLNGDGVGSELKNYSRLLDVERVESIQDDCWDSLNLKRIKNLSFDTVKRNNTLNSDKYYIDTYELEPKFTENLQTILSFKLPLQLQRKPDKYSGKLNIEKLTPNTFIPIALTIVNRKNGKLEKIDTIQFNDSSTHYASNIDISNYKNGDTLISEVSLAALYKNTFYPGTIITAKENEGFRTNFIGDFEQKLKILGIFPMSDRMFRITGSDDQQSAKNLWDGILLGILLIIAFSLISCGIYIYVFSKKPYDPYPNQFNEIDILEF